MSASSAGGAHPASDGSRFGPGKAAADRGKSNTHLPTYLHLCKAARAKSLIYRELVRTVDSGQVGFMKKIAAKANEWVFRHAQHILAVYVTRTNVYPSEKLLTVWSEARGSFQAVAPVNRPRKQPLRLRTLAPPPDQRLESAVSTDEISTCRLDRRFWIRNDAVSISPQDSGKRSTDLGALPECLYSRFAWSRSGPFLGDIVLRRQWLHSPFLRAFAL
jgi:hypothetical protein